jgi:hypothetical protein
MELTLRNIEAKLSYGFLLLVSTFRMLDAEYEVI